ncbi:MAG: hypothetical protein ACRCUT_07940 [Spirochaetota bacterium]
MKKYLCVLCAVIISSSMAGCKKEQMKIDDRGIQTADAPAETQQFEQEGFISRDTFRVIIVRPSDSAVSDEETEKQAKMKALMSLKRYITAEGKALQPNADAQLRNLINDNGTIQPHEDAAAHRTIFVLEISKQGCRAYVDGMGK